MVVTEEELKIDYERRYGRRYRCIYALVDPRNNGIFYIGQTTRPDLRLDEHLISTEVAIDFRCWQEDTKSHRKEQYIADLWEETGLDPILDILIEGHYTFKEMSKIEIEMIKTYLRKGVWLMNRMALVWKDLYGIGGV